MISSEDSPPALEDAAEEPVAALPGADSLLCAVPQAVSCTIASTATKANADVFLCFIMIFLSVFYGMYNTGS